MLVSKMTTIIWQRMVINYKLIENDNIQGAPETLEEDSVGEAIALSDALIKRLLSLSNEKKDNTCTESNFQYHNTSI